MNVDDLRSFYNVKNDQELSQKLNLTKGTISKWRKNGVSPLWQACFELVTDGELQADRKKMPHILTP